MICINFETISLLAISLVKLIQDSEMFDYLHLVSRFITTALFVYIFYFCLFSALELLSWPLLKITDEWKRDRK